MKRLNNYQYVLLRKNAKSALKEFPDLRPGQALFNALSDISPDIADNIVGSKFDPFYDDKKIKYFLKYLNEDIYGRK